MSDRELLEKAAKAAGLGTTVPVFGVPPFMGLRLLSGALWNPLESDGDALRLAVKLDIAINIGQVTAGATWWVRPDLIEQDGVSEHHNGDPCAATRRAIVRAAAKIGESHGLA